MSSLEALGLSASSGVALGALLAFACAFVIWQLARTWRAYRLRAGADPVPLTPESGGALRYADLVLDLARGRVLAVREFIVSMRIKP